MRKKWCTKIEGVYVHWPCWWLWHNTTLWEPQNAYFLTLHNLDLNFGTKGPNNKETFQFLTPKGKKTPDLEIGKNLGRILNRNLGLRWMMLGGNISNVHNGLHHLVISYSQCHREATIWKSRQPTLIDFNHFPNSLYKHLIFTIKTLLPYTHPQCEPDQNTTFAHKVEF